MSYIVLIYTYFMSYIVLVHAYFMSYMVCIHAYFMSYIVLIHTYFMSYIVIECTYFVYVLYRDQMHLFRLCLISCPFQLICSISYKLFFKAYLVHVLYVA